MMKNRMAIPVVVVASTDQNASLISKYIPLVPLPNPASTLSVSFSF